MLICPPVDVDRQLTKINHRHKPINSIVILNNIVVFVGAELKCGLSRFREFGPQQDRKFALDVSSLGTLMAFCI